jgi:hypothetical protein
MNESTCVPHVLTCFLFSHSKEFLQLLRYEEGQFYVNHHDFIPGDVTRPAGQRIVTVFLYLNNVDEGGGTYFTDMDITVTPKRGMAVIWPSVSDEDPNVRDPFTHHQALPVIKGIKYAANAWVSNSTVQYSTSIRACTRHSLQCFLLFPSVNLTCFNRYINEISRLPVRLGASS